MNIIISPAKKMKIASDFLTPPTMPIFLEDAEKIKGVLSGYTRECLKGLLKANDDIVELNYQRLRCMELSCDRTPAILAYTGLQYQSMSPDVFTENQWKYVEKHLRILSGFYGILKACDGVVPYRLEMQAKLALGESKDLYQYWGDRLYHELIREDPVVLNLASKEYSKVIEAYINTPARMVSCVFGEWQQKSGKIKVKATAAKMARGDMVRWLAETGIQDVNDVREYKGMGYEFVPEQSSETEYVFGTRTGCR